MLIYPCMVDLCVYDRAIDVVAGFVHGSGGFPNPLFKHCTWGQLLATHGRFFFE